MAQPIQPFSGAGGYGETMSPYYEQISGQVGDAYIARQNQKVDNAIKAFSEIRNAAAMAFGVPAGGAGAGSAGGGGFFESLGRATGFTKDAGLMNAMNPSSLSQYYAQSSELDKKSNAMKKMLELNPEMFGLDKDQAKQLGDVTSKMSSTERSAFFQNYVPTLFKAQQSNLERQFATQKALAAQKPPLDFGGLDTAIDSIWNPKPAQPSMQPSMGDTTQPATDLAEFLRRKGWSGTGPVPKALMREFEAS
jgi:hypothetical protein